MKQVLLTVSGMIDRSREAQISMGLRPRADYLELARAFDADLIDYAEAGRITGRLGVVIRWLLGANVLLAWACFLRRRRYRVIWTDGEQVGIPLALMLKLARCRRVRHRMFVHRLSVRKKMLFFDLFRIQSHIHTFVVYSIWQQQFIHRRWHIPRERVVFTPFMVDADFFSPEKVTSRRRRMICSVGLEFRDYPTLLEAVRGLDVEVVIAAASPWSKRTDTTRDQAIPPNVTVRRFSQFELRQLYADCLFVVMPLYEVDFQAGVTAILEAMAMERAVICSRTRGQTDVVVDNVTGLYVRPENAPDLRQAITALLCDPHRAARMGAAAQDHARRHMSLDVYAAQLRPLVLVDDDMNPALSTFVHGHPDRV